MGSNETGSRANDDFGGPNRLSNAVIVDPANVASPGPQQLGFGFLDDCRCDLADSANSVFSNGAVTTPQSWRDRVFVLAYHGFEFLCRFRQDFLSIGIFRFSSSGPRGFLQFLSDTGNRINVIERAADRATLKRYDYTIGCLFSIKHEMGT